MVRRGRRFDALVDVARVADHRAPAERRLLLAGYSFGGDVAFAAARRLVDTGRRRCRSWAFWTPIWSAAPRPPQRSSAGPMLAIRPAVAGRRSRMTGCTPAQGSCCRSLRGVVGAGAFAAPRQTVAAVAAGAHGFAFDQRMRLILRLRARWQWHRTRRTARWACRPCCSGQRRMRRRRRRIWAGRSRCSRAAGAPVAATTAPCWTRRTVRCCAPVLPRRCGRRPNRAQCSGRDTGGAEMPGHRPHRHSPARSPGSGAE